MHYGHLKASVAKALAIRFTTILTGDGAGFERPDGSREPAIVAPAVYPGGRGNPEPVINALQDGDIVELRTVLDSVGSQANRSEDALDRHIQAGPTFPFPYISIAIDNDEQTLLSGLLAPHRGADAYFRATDEAAYFADIFKMSLGQSSYDENCSLALERFPTNLVYGAWNASVNALARTPRVYRSHIDGITRISLDAFEKRGLDAIKVFGQANRRDPFIGFSATLYERDVNGEKRWTRNPENAKPADVKKAKEFESKSKKPGDGKNPFSLSSHGLGDIIANKALRGVRIDYAIQSSIISLATLRSFRFPLDGVVSADRDLAAQSYIAALAILGYELARARGYYLRSGCSLVTTQSRRELIATGSAAPAAGLPWDGRDGQTDLDVALGLYAAAVADIAEHNFNLAPRKIIKASPELIELLNANGKAVRADFDDGEAA